MRNPTIEDAIAVVENALQVRATDARRFPTGLCHFVYEVTLEQGEKVVARLAKADTAHLLAAGVRWHEQLQPLDLPLPRQLFAGLADVRPHVILSRLPGDDLGNVYARLDDEAKRAIATAVVAAQSRAARLPEAAGFGHALSYADTALCRRRNWRQVLDDLLLRSRQRMMAMGAIDPALVDRLVGSLDRFEPYFAQVRPVAFLDDITTKNVIVHADRLSGIVDVDEICFGDPLLTVGLTQMALLAKRLDTRYVEHWLNCLSATEEQRAVVYAYAAVFCVDFLSEQGQRFNRDKAEVDAEEVAFLRATLATLLERVNS